MTPLTRYEGIVRRGRIELSAQAELPEGSHVVVILTGPKSLVDEAAARRKANRWLVESVGNMLAADEGRLVEHEGQPLWRFGAYVTGRGHIPWGPIGHVDVDAQQGDVLHDNSQTEQLIINAKALVSSILSSE
ncbi:protein of unknown function [Candidatus Promineifilum breve]|uniref:Uncharacterized protein n=1 Tax=Candidatus Promineifilum breve TaxID=1806508 RepID=A0A161KAM1_9CHLR|nr:hypothetical protein [Candidatus Promineifilum breve]CUS03683.2 protein of unknown function [Candidatus Promineifilum breve]